ncbi:acyl transferase/acyl hydrolase/lysophospholipase [Pseudomassariella vexata]|uniref:Acyl transferase/acyl hydrolase/lysophospholipase n=1 Tax=Pseudomassariella vexata TaxID=1141098 RepID=A0A1Y2DS80_9PEZI|nr:acyl transferase/acyl hydrolase/lysophospholipase [Pseudomassariella vexata]ORY62120.1 acyl transferase/acyl hydrolase/lysophospholipase [Pseudomassariella vexata]
MASSATVTIETTERGLRVLSLDGGGVRGMSTLLILRHLMKRINYKDTPKPCDYFDIIAGTSTGGLIAIMLGRLRMSVQECIDAYQSISETVFQPKRSRLNVLGKGKDLWTLEGAFDADELAKAMRDIVVKTGEAADAKMLETDPTCKV